MGRVKTDWSYTGKVNQSQAIEKAKEFARTRYYGETENISREQEQKIAEMRSRLGDRGVAMSGTMIARQRGFMANRLGR